MASRDPRGRILVLSCALGVSYAAFVGCGSTDGKRDVRREDGGAGGEAGQSPTAGTPASGGNMSSGGNGGTSVIPPLGGAGGEPPVVVGGTGGAAPIGGTDEGGSAGTSTDLGGAGADAGGMGGEGGGGGEPSCVPTAGSRITLGFDANNAEWVNNLKWLDSTNTLTANLSASGGSGLCSEPTEFFGQAYGAPEGTTPLIVYAGSRATSTSCGLDVTLVSTPNNCGGTAQLQWQTEYHFYGGAKADQLRVTRTFPFDETTPKFSGSLRPWQPRVKLTSFAQTIYPKGDGSGITTTNLNSCPGDCITPTGVLANQWTGEWFADITASGLALIVRRDPSMASPVSLTVNYDSFSNSNLSSFVLVQPADGWKAPITEVEYLCMADLTTWPQAQRDAAQLPAFCGP